MKNNKKVVKYRKPFNINIGVIIFVIIFIYLLFNIFSYLTTTHVSVYEVEQGTIAVNNIYNGLILREEKIYTSQYTGSLNYYVKEASRVGYNQLVYSVDENGSVSDMITEASQNASGMNSEQLDELEETIYDFQNSYQSESFYNVYTFKENMNASLNQALSLGALNEISDYVATAEGNNTFHKAYSDADGIISYHTDGFENVTTDTFTSAMFDVSTYASSNLKANTEVSSGAPAYKLITSEQWYIVLPIPADTAKQLVDGEVVRIRFVKDQKEMNAYYTLVQKDGQNFLILSLKSGMVRYAAERYIEVELLLSEETGLKIPNSAIVEKEFYTIPSDYFLKGGDSNASGLLVKHSGENGSETTEFISPTIYYETDDHCYIDSEDIQSGDVLMKQNSSETYTVGKDTGSLKGVYNINKGYAVFKQIDILYQNEEYTVVKTGTSYGISLYDHIALDGSKVNENELVK